ncbi:atypical/ABC1 protein kinase [Sphaeroforma arctica JP610]|uniref:Atypical/ABC1 protein kinase n=1 Tax=Sphaeroforma arctica JP610 TaxID=667725 RepID=A0A0L0GA25_9EUKA|nr:atypical/ABC1 protein kinase [Sphaeroforma arctica JP610]KNC85731.1 atypical/ABC1 protein kinase [Sphaeroforma arctica JP610]|eukprot:XP_014159633.1 atypical/ABC1 protein kinase [Sphaeroforma arctica JP610]
MVTRTFRTLKVAGSTIYDYKFCSEREPLEDVHERVANRVLNLCQKNGGLYVKLGQGIASMNHILPPQFNRVFSVLHDKAPMVDWASVQKTIQADFGRPYNELYATFDHQAVASASIAQVHKATLHDGTSVAVKVQKPCIARQVDLDLMTYRLIVWVFERAFDLPMYWTVAYTEENLRKELDFQHEAANSNKAKEQLSTFDNVYVPTVYSDRTTKRVLTSEWIDGAKMNDPEAMDRIGVNVDEVVKTLVNVSGFQVFISGFCHADVHFGNLLVRKKANGHELVILDHGLYVEESNKFREEYCQLWKSMFLLDVDGMKEICKKWGITDHELFASFTLMKPYSTKRPVASKVSRAEVMQLQRQAKDRVRRLLEDTSLFPKELIFIGRSMNIVRANNKHLGSPVNRVNVLVSWANQGTKRSNAKYSWYLHEFRFRIQMFVVDIFYYSSRLWQKLNETLGYKVDSFEGVLEKALPTEALGFSSEISESGMD